MKNIQDTALVSQSELEYLQAQLLTQQFLVVEGAYSTGKSTLIRSLLRENSGSAATVITVFVDSTTDLKSLVGCYVCNEKIGQFEWRDAPLSSCLKLGHTLLLENF